MSVTSIYQLVSDAVAALSGGPINASPVPVSGYMNSSGTTTIIPFATVGAGAASSSAGGGPVQRWLVSGSAANTYVVPAATPAGLQIYDLLGYDSVTHTVNFGYTTGALPNASGYRCSTLAGLSVAPNQHSTIGFIGIDGTSYVELFRTTGIAGQ